VRGGARGGARHERDPGLTDPAGPDDRYQPGLSEQRDDPCELVLPAHEVCVPVVWKSSDH
jgi:hypothetical protein